MTRALVTGATGFVGQKILKALSERNINVRAIVRNGKEEAVRKLPCVDQIVFTSSLFEESREWWRCVAKDVDLVIHAAWYAEPGKYINSSRNLECITGTLTMAEGCVEAGVKRFVGIGTCAEYDHTAGHLSTATALQPASIYAAAKAATFFSLSQWLPRIDVGFVWCRLFYLYGEGEDARRFVPYLRTQLAAGKPTELTSGNQVRDFLDVTVAGAMIADLALGSRTGPVNICSGVPITIRQMAENIADEYGRRDLLHFGRRLDNPFDPPFIVGIP